MGWLDDLWEDTKRAFTWEKPAPTRTPSRSSKLRQPTSGRSSLQQWAKEQQQASSGRTSAQPQPVSTAPKTTSSSKTQQKSVVDDAAQRRREAIARINKEWSETQLPTLVPTDKEPTNKIGEAVQITQQRPTTENEALKDYRVEQKEKLDADAAARQRYDRALGIVPGEPYDDNVEGETYELTDAQYNALNAAQRAAVDANTLLADAVKEDLAKKQMFSTLSKGQLSKYKDSLRGQFEVGQGSKFAAPNTVLALDQLGIKNKFDDLDDYLQLRALANDDDIALLKDKGNRPVLELPYESDQTPQQQELNNMLVNAGAPRRPAQVDLRNRLMTQLSDAGLRLQKHQEIVNTRPNTGDEELDDAILYGVDQVAGAQNPLKAYQTLQSQITPEEFSAFDKFLNEHSLNAHKYHLPLGTTEGIKYANAADIRRDLGYEK